jgi:rhodanese-related sulfurtransferase
MSFLKKMFGYGESQPEVTPPPASLPQAPPQPLRITEISPQELKTQLENGRNVMVVDMRSPGEYQAGHIPGAISMFVQTIPARLSELPQDRPIVFQCWHGHTSLDASGFLVQNGWPAANIASLTGGIAGWVQVHGPGSLVRD